MNKFNKSQKKKKSEIVITFDKMFTLQFEFIFSVTKIPQI